MTKQCKNRESEHGGAGIKFLLTVVVLILIANAGYNYIPTAYQGQDFKQEMETAVMQGVTMPGANTKQVDAVRARVRRAAEVSGIPDDYYLEVKQTKNVVHAHVIYQKTIPILPFALYDYVYQFDNTATPTGFLMKDSS